MKLVLTLLLALLAGAPAGARGQVSTHPAGSPAAVADSFLSMIARKEFVRATEFVDSASLEGFRHSRLRNLRLQDSMEKSHPRPRRTDLPPAVADYFEAQMKKHQEDAGSYIQREFGVSSIAELERMTGAQVFARWLESQHPETQLRHMLRMHGKDSLALSFVPAAGYPRTPLVVGAVAASASLAYAIFHDSLAAPPGISPRVLPLRLFRAGWRLDATEAEVAIIDGMCMIGFAMVEDESEVPTEPPK